MELSHFNIKSDAFGGLSLSKGHEFCEAFESGWRVAPDILALQPHRHVRRALVEDSIISRVVVHERLEIGRFSLAHFEGCARRSGEDKNLEDCQQGEGVD